MQKSSALRRMGCIATRDLWMRNLGALRCTSNQSSDDCEVAQYPLKNQNSASRELGWFAACHLACFRDDALQRRLRLSGSCVRESVCVGVHGKLHVHVRVLCMCWYAPCHTHCNTLQHIVTHCSTLQHTTTHCNTLQHTATHCNTREPTRVLFWWHIELVIFRWLIEFVTFTWPVHLHDPCMCSYVFSVWIYFDGA